MNTDRYLNMRQLASKLSVSVRGLYMATLRSKSVSGLDQEHVPANDSEKKKRNSKVFEIDFVVEIFHHNN